MSTNYVYVTTPNGVDEGRDMHTVGFYSPDGKWHPESDHTEREAAANRVRFLNGGNIPEPTFAHSGLRP